MENLTPMALSVVCEGGRALEDVGTAVLALAHKGVIQIEWVPRPDKDDPRDDFIIQGKGTAYLDDPLSRATWRYLFGDEEAISDRSIRLSEEDKKIVTRVEAFKKAVSDSLMDSGLFRVPPISPERTLYFAGAGGIVLGVALGVSGARIPGVMVIVGGCLLTIYQYLRPKLTAEGNQIYAAAKDIEQALRTMPIPEADPAAALDLFTLWMPIASALRLSRAWCRRFRGIDFGRLPTWLSIQGDYKTDSFEVGLLCDHIAAALRESTNPRANELAPKMYWRSEQESS